VLILRFPTVDVLVEHLVFVFENWTGESSFCCLVLHLDLVFKLLQCSHSKFNLQNQIGISFVQKDTTESPLSDLLSKLVRFTDDGVLVDGDFLPDVVFPHVIDSVPFNNFVKDACRDVRSEERIKRNLTRDEGVFNSPCFLYDLVDILELLVESFIIGVGIEGIEDSYNVV
jgi:hypothetical protein